MTDNVVQLPRPHDARGPISSLGFYVRVGRNDHRDMLDILAEDECGFFGLVIDAPYTYRHRELRAEARRRGFDVILDPKTQAMATIGGYTRTLGETPWGLERPHRFDDFSGAEGRMRAEQFVQFAVENEFTHVLGLTHLLQGSNDPWLRRDIDMMGAVRAMLEGQSARILLIYPLAIPMQVMRDSAQRRAIIAAIADASFDALWLKTDNFGSDATGDKTSAYIEACHDFHSLDIPVIADHVGGLPSLGLLAFGAVGGVTHGITLLEGFKSDRWRRPPTGEVGRTPATRVYIPHLDMLFKRDEASEFLNGSPRIRSRFGCRDTHCCPHGLQDMLGRPTRHYIHQRSREIDELSATPLSLRVGHYLDNHVRRVSDDVAAAAGFGAIDDHIRARLSKKQRSMSRFRTAIVHLAETASIGSVAALPARHSTSEGDRG